MSDHEIEVCRWETSEQALMSVRYPVFVEEQHVPVALEHDEYDQNAIHVLVRDNKQNAIATGRMLNDGHIGRMAVLPDWRGKGLGSAILRTLINIAKNQGLQSVFLNAQCDAIGFYTRLQFVAHGDVFDDAGIPHQRMSLELTDKVL